MDRSSHAPLPERRRSGTVPGLADRAANRHDPTMASSLITPLLAMRGSGWQAIWTFIAILAGVRTLGELFRHGWSGLVLIGLLCLAAATGFALVARRCREATDERDLAGRPPALRRRAADPILPGRRFF